MSLSGDPDDIDWKAWNEDVKGVDFLVYDPPQLKPSFFGCLAGLNWMTPRSPFCAQFPCCGAQALQNLVLFPCCGAETNKISQPDAWFTKMLRNNPSSKCPEFLKGVWWMKDNVANEVLITFQSIPWESEFKGTKNARYNWSTELNCYGSALASVFATGANGHTFRVSPDRKWINIGPSSWIYVLGRSDKLVAPDGTRVPFTPGEDLLRVSFNGASAKSGISYQYIVRRVAYEDSRGRLVKTAGYDELLEKVQLPSVPGVCGQLGYCNIPSDEYRKIFEPLGDEQIIVYQPERKREAKAAVAEEEKAPSRGASRGCGGACSPKKGALSCCI